MTQHQIVMCTILLTVGITLTSCFFGIGHPAERDKIKSIQITPFEQDLSFKSLVVSLDFSQMRIEENQVVIVADISNESDDVTVRLMRSRVEFNKIFGAQAFVNATQEFDSTSAVLPNSQKKVETRFDIPAEFLTGNIEKSPTIEFQLYFEFHYGEPTQKRLLAFRNQVLFSTERNPD